MFIVVGAFGLLGSLLPGQGGHHAGITTAVNLLTLAVGLLARTNWVWMLRDRRALVLPAIALSTVAVSNAAGVVPPAALGLFFVMIFLWIGQWHPPGTSLLFVPFAVLTYLLPLGFGAPHSLGVVPSVLFVVGGSSFAGETLARQTRAARRARRQHEQSLQILERAGKSDDLTGLGNRRLGNSLLDGLKAGDAIALLDIDHFKRVNDTLGHASGDQLLQEFGAFLDREIAARNTVARMGGEEFLVVFAQTDPEVVILLVQALLNAWQATSPLATFSAGIAVHSEQSPAKTYAAADAAMYAAKVAGRNRLSCSTRSETPRGVGHPDLEAGAVLGQTPAAI